MPRSASTVQIYVALVSTICPSRCSVPTEMTSARVIDAGGPASSVCVTGSIPRRKCALHHIARPPQPPHGPPVDRDIDGARVSHAYGQPACGVPDLLVARAHESLEDRRTVCGRPNPGTIISRGDHVQGG